MAVLKTIVLFDLDGTLANIDHRRHLVEGASKLWREFYAACSADTVNVAVSEVFQAIQGSGYQCWVVSGRSDEVRPETTAWLSKHDLFPDALFMRRSGDHQPDHKLKQSWLDDGAIPKKHVLCVYDDRSSVVAMWRANGLPCFQVAPGDF